MKRGNVFKVARFFISGGMSAIIGFSVLYGLTEYGRMWYLLSSVLSFILSDVFSFVVKKFWVFEERDIKEAKLQIFLYLGLSVMYIVVSTGLLFIFVEQLHIQYIISQIIIVSVLFTPSYVLSQRIFNVQKIQQR